MTPAQERIYVLTANHRAVVLARRALSGGLFECLNDGERGEFHKAWRAAERLEKITLEKLRNEQEAQA